MCKMDVKEDTESLVTTIASLQEVLQKGRGKIIHFPSKL